MLFRQLLLAVAICALVVLTSGVLGHSASRTAEAVTDNQMAVDSDDAGAPVAPTVNVPVGNTVDISVHITKANPDYAGYSAAIEYDSAVVTFVPVGGLGVVYTGLGGMTLDFGATDVAAGGSLRQTTAGQARVSGTTTATGEAVIVRYDCVAPGATALTLVPPAGAIDNSTTLGPGGARIPTGLTAGQIVCKPPPPADGDGDGIADNVDTQPTGFSDNFSDVPLGGMTSGEILTRGSFDVNVTDAPSSTGVRVRTKGTIFTAAALIRLDCSPEIVVAGVGYDTVLGCTGSAIVDVLSGPVSATFAGITVDLPTGTKVTVAEVSPGKFTVTNASTSSTSITVDGELVAPGETSALLTGFPPIVVGGLVVDLDSDLGDLPLETAGSSGTSAGVAAAVAVAAGTLALGGAAWYARRRLR